MNGDNSGKRLLFIGGAVLLGIAVVNNAYRAGLSAGLVASGRVNGVHDIDGWGLIPFPPFPLIVVGFLLFLAYRRGAFGGPRPGHHGGHGNHHAGDRPAFGPGRGPERGFGGQPPRFVEDWHRRLHEAERQQAANGGNGSVAPAAAPQQPAAPAPSAAGQAPAGDVTNL
jgi:hypothetical protein